MTSSMMRGMRVLFLGLMLMISAAAVFVPLRAVFAACDPAHEYCNPLQFDSLDGALGSVLSKMQSLIVVLAIIFIVVGAILYVTSAGNDSRMTLAKSAITAALIGLALGIAAPLFLKEVSCALGWAELCAPAGPTLTSVALKVLNFLLSITGVLAIIMLVIGGFMYITAAGDEGRAEMGKKIVTYAVIGIAVALSALVMVTQIARFFV